MTKKKITEKEIVNLCTELKHAFEASLKALDLIIEKLSDTESKEEKAPVEETKEEITVTSEVTRAYSFEKVRGIMATLAASGKKVQAKVLLSRFGASRLSDVKESDYPALVKQAEEIKNE